MARWRTSGDGAHIAVSDHLGNRGTGRRPARQTVGTSVLRRRGRGPETVTVTRLFHGDRDRVRRLATTAAFHLLAAAL
ncbi:CinA family protein [Gordonia spumicola]|uniref:CinA family protein n=1 Tax=Gordonia spumicola TaxID=589161 RepID=UPI0035314EDD